MKENETRVQVLQLPLGTGQRPDITAPSQGRFIVIYKRFVDPLIYEKGRKITVAGVVEGSQAIMLNDVRTTCPCCSSGRHTCGKQRSTRRTGPGPAVQFGIGIGVSR